MHDVSKKLYHFLIVHIFAAQLNCGGILNKHFIANCLQNISVKEIWKSVNIWRRCGQEKWWHVFWNM